MLEHHNQHAAEFLSFPPYTPRQLTYIERKLRLWYKIKNNLQGWSKSKVIDVFGSATANRVYNDERKKPRYKIEAENALICTLSNILDTKGFATKDELLREAAKPSANGQYAEVLARYIWLYNKAWEEASRRILHQANAKYKRPTNVEKMDYGLPGNTWIIIKEQ